MILNIIKHKDTLYMLTHHVETDYKLNKDIKCLPHQLCK